MDTNANPFAADRAAGDHIPVASTVANSRPASPTDRTQSRPLDQHQSASSSASDRSASPTDTTRVPSAALEKGKTAPSTLEKQTTVSSTLAHHPHLQAIRTAGHDVRDKLHLHSIHSIHATGPSNRLFNPTNLRVHIRWKGDQDREDDTPSSRLDDEHHLIWRSRDNRKRRHSSVVPAIPQRKPIGSRLTAQLKETSKILWRMFFSFPYWDMAFWSGWSYTWGSVLFVMDGAWAFMELAMPGSVSESVATYGGPLCFFIGAILYQIGATMAYLEAVNDGSFRGSAMRRFLEGHEDHSKSLVDAKIHSFLTRFTSHVDEEKPSVPRRGAVDMGPAEQGHPSVYNTWRWWPTWHALRTHHIYEIGYLACTIQLFGATLYGICGVVNLPGILSSLVPWQKEAAYWIPQIVASVCFLTAGIMFTLETQQKWNKPEPATIGWWIGIWAVIGSIGFL